MNAANTMTRSARRQAPWPWPVALLLVMIAVCPAAARADDTPAALAPAAPNSGEGADLAKPPTWQVPSRDEVERTLQAWLERSGLPAERRQASRGRSPHTLASTPKSGTRAPMGCRHSGHAVTDEEAHACRLQ